MAKLCSQCQSSIGFLAKKGWDVSETGEKFILCWGCCTLAREPIERHRLSKRYTSMEVTTVPHLPLNLPLLCVACAKPIIKEESTQVQTLAVSHTTPGSAGQSTISSISTTVRLCPRCEGLGFRPTDFLRFRSQNQGKLIIDIGNDKVAMDFKTCIDADMKQARDHFNEKRRKAISEQEKIHFDTMNKMMARCGIQSVEKYAPGDEGFVG